MNEVLGKEPTRRRFALIVELVGPACAGKTTLTKALTERSTDMTVAPDISVRKPGHLALFLRNAPLSLPVMLHPWQNNRWFTWDEIKSIVYLNGWPRVLSKQAASHRGMILLDQGPVFRMATLHAFGPNILRKPAAAMWWNDMFRQWESVLDLLIWLDAPNPVLVQRINLRDRWHPVRARPEQEISEYLDRYRTSYHYVLANLAIGRGSAVLAFDTSQMTTDDLVNTALSIGCQLQPTCMTHRRTRVGWPRRGNAPKSNYLDGDEP